jgi:hypothetical protein
VLGRDDAQRMIAGRLAMRYELAHQFAHEFARVHTLQLRIDLPRADTLGPSGYVDLTRAVHDAHARVRRARVANASTARSPYGRPGRRSRRAGDDAASARRRRAIRQPRRALRDAPGRCLPGSGTR